MPKIADWILSTAIVMIMVTSLVVEAHAGSVTIVSGPTSTIILDNRSNANQIGNAQNVCLNATTPSNCPTTAPPPASPTLYGYNLPAWGVDLSSIPGATWIWAPRITGTTSGAANAEVTFRTVFYLCEDPQGDATISVAADNSADVYVNGSSTSALTANDNSGSNSTLATVAIPAGGIPDPAMPGQFIVKFKQGLNWIDVVAKNGPNPPDCGNDQYQCNPAGIVFGATISDALNPWPKCDGTFDIGTVQMTPIACPDGQRGTANKTCLCVFDKALWELSSNYCPPRPTTCTGNNGVIFQVGGVETLSCAANQVGSDTRTCQADGTWKETNMCRTVCTGSNGQIFEVGGVETFSCAANEVGSRTRTCQADGTWNEVNACRRQQAGAGEWCGAEDRDPPQVFDCPAGTVCGHRKLPTPPRSIWCILFGIDCPARLWTVDWYCDPS
jgi:hypothetical protein